MKKNPDRCEVCCYWDDQGVFVAECKATGITVFDGDNQAIRRHIQTAATDWCADFEKNKKPKVKK